MELLRGVYALVSTALLAVVLVPRDEEGDVERVAVAMNKSAREFRTRFYSIARDSNNTTVPKR
jgi:hypothetical protein